MTIALELPQTTDLLDPTAKLSSGFIKSLPVPVGLWCPSKLRNVAVDFNPLKKNFGTLNGGITTVPGGFGTLAQSWSLNGSTSYAEFQNTPLLNPSSAITVFAAFSLRVFSVNGNIISKGYTSSSSPFIQYSLKQNSAANGAIDFQVTLAGSNENITTATNLSPNISYLVTGVYNGSTQSIYINKSLSASISRTGSLSTYATPLEIGRWGTANSQYSNMLFYVGGIFPFALTASQVSSLYNCLLTGKPFPLFEPDTLYIDEPQTSTTLNLTSKSFVFSSSNSQVSIQRNINTQSDSLSDSQGNITFTRDLKSTLDSRSFSSSATSVLRPLVSELISQSESGAAETRQILASSIIASQSFSSGKFALSAFINLESTAFAESFSYVEINLSRALNSTGFSLSDLLAEISVKRNLSSIGLSLSDSISQETILRPLDSESISQAKDHAEISIEQLLTSEVLSSSLAKGQFTTQLYTKFEVLSYRRYSSQYFVQSGSVNDSGQ